MNCKDRRSYIFVLIGLLFACPIFSADYDLKIKMGPILHYKGQDRKEGIWHVSALYVVEKGTHSHSHLSYQKFKNSKAAKIDISLARILGERFEHEFIRYDMKIKQSAEETRVEYSLPGEKGSHTFFVPGRNQPVNFLYYSCNGYQSEEDRESVGGIQPMWHEINRRHHEKPFHVALGGGDQLYADGLIDSPGKDIFEPSKGKIHGVFALKQVQKWLKHKDTYRKDSPSTKMSDQVDRFYFEHYAKQFNEAELKESMASVAGLNQWDDHDCFDGCGSYPDELQNCPVFCHIREKASWYNNTVQHQLGLDESDPEGNNFLYEFNTLAILGVDTRTQRTADQIVSPQGWDKIFNMLEGLDKDIEHLVVMLAVPVVYAASPLMEKAYELADKSTIVDYSVKLLPVVGKKNAFDYFELADDGRDGWGHHAHIAERNIMIARFQKFALEKNIRVSFFSGDVHLGGAGKIYPKHDGVHGWSNDTIWQVISSPVGNVTPGKIAAHFIGHSAMHEQKLCDKCVMRLVKLRREKSTKEAPSLIAARNFVSFELLHHYLEVKWSAESKKHKPHRTYTLSIPPAQR